MNVIYFKDIGSIGGVEQFIWYLSKKFNFTLYYNSADTEQIKRLSQNIECRKYKEPIKCDKFFCNYGLYIEAEAKEKYHIAHCDYKYVWFKPILYDGFKYIGVSKTVCDSFKELTGKDIELIYNPIYLRKPKVSKYNDGKLHLISTTRLSREKGLERMKKLVKKLDDAKIDYVWEIYTNRPGGIDNKNIVFKKPKLDILEEIAKADVLVQLSDCEAYCYSVVEALKVGTKVLVTDLPVFKELGLKHGENAIICNFNMDNLDLDMLKKEMNFTYKPPKDNWSKYLSTEKTYNKNELVEVKILKKYTDIYLKRELIKGHIEKMPKYRASYLEAKGLVEWL